MSIWIFYLAVGVSLLLMSVVLVLIMRARSRSLKLGKLFSTLWRGLRQRQPIKELWRDLLSLVTDLNTGPGGRYENPWLLVIGEPDSGRSRLMHALGKGDRAHPLSRLLKRSPRHAAWQVLDKGVLIDAQQQEEGEAGLKSVLSDLNQLRPERPVDGVVLTISAETLLSRSRERQRTVARQLHSLLWLLQKELEFVLPVYVVITQTDRVPGYRTFWRRFEALQGQIFGWSSPNELEARFQPEWVAKGLDQITRQLYNLQAAELAGFSEETLSVADARDFVLFPRQLAALEESLTHVLGEVFDKTVYESGASVRGFYFSGALDRHSAPLGVAELARQKWFAERHLAQPLRRAVWSRNLRLRRVQRTSLWLLGGLFLSLLISAADLKRQTQLQLETVQLLKATEQQIGVSSDCKKPLAEEDYFSLLRLISGIQDRAIYWNIPYSWFDARTSRSTSKVIADGAFAKLIFPALRCRLQARAQALLKPEASGLSGQVERTETELYAYTTELLAFEHHLALYRRIVRYANASELDNMREAFYKLTQYLYDRAVPHSLARSDTAFTRALLKVDYKQPLELPEHFQSRVLAALSQRSQRLADALHGEVKSGVMLLDKLAGDEPVSRGDADRFAQWTNNIDLRWLGSTAQDNVCRDQWNHLDGALGQLRDSYSYPAAGLGKVAAPFQARACDEPLLDMLEDAEIPPFLRVLEQSDVGLNWTVDFTEELELLRNLLGQSFMEDSSEGIAWCDSSVLVKRAPLTQALTHLRSYQQFISQPRSNAGTAGPGDLVDRLARGQIVGLVSDRMAEALQRPPHARTQEEQVERLSDAFAGSQEELVALVRLYGQLDLELDDTHWYSCLNQTAAFQLGAVDQLYQSSSLYLPTLTENDSPLLYRRTGDKASLKDYLNGQQIRVQRLVNYARPYTRWFDEAASQAREAANSRRFFWDNTVRQLDLDLQFSDDGSQLAQLRSYYQQNLLQLSIDNCNQQLKAPGMLSNDLFSERQQAIYEEADLLCIGHNESTLAADYKALAEGFNRLLAGKFPFASLGAPDLEPRRWQQFSQQFGSQLEMLSTQADALEGVRWEPMQTFLYRIKQARIALDPLYLAGQGAPVQLQTRFRSQPHRRNADEQIVLWSLNTPTTQIHYPNGGDQLVWQPGQPLSLDLNWAQLSTQRPRRDPAQSDMRVEDTQARFSSKGPWALLRLVQAHRELVSPQEARAELRFQVPVRTTDSGKTGAVAASATNGTTTKSTGATPLSADARLTFNFAIQAADGGLWQPWQLAGEFPQQAPIIW